MKEIKFKAEDKVKVIAEFVSYLDSLEDNKEYTITIKEFKQKRSLSANAYFWLLCDKLASRIHESKTAIYQEYIKNIGGVSDEVKVTARAAERFRQVWSANGLGFQVEFLTDPRECEPDEKIEAIAYYGSSTFDTEQMSRLIDMVVQDCKTFGIETKDPAELEQLLDEWGAR